MPLAMSVGAAVRSTSLNSSLAVLPSRFFSACGSLSPGTCTTIRCAPWRMIVGSRVPSASIRLRTTSVAVSIAWLIARSMPSLVGVSTNLLPSTTRMSQSRWPVIPAPVVSGRIASRAASTCAGLSTMNESAPSLVDTSPWMIRGSAWRSRWRTLSSIVSSRCRPTCAGLASSRMWLPPARSSPRLTCGSLNGAGRLSPLTASNDGSAARQASTVSDHSHSCFQRGKSSMSYRAPNHGPVRPVQSFAGFAPTGGITSEIVDFSALTFSPAASSTSA